MDYNGLYKSILLLKLESGEYVPLASVLPSYGPFNSMSEALADLGDTFRAITNVPRGYTFCLIENGKPQEYWFTKEGDVNSIEKKNTSSSSTVISGVQFRAGDEYIQVSYDGGTTWNNLVSLDSIRGPRGYSGATGPQGPTGADGDITKIQLRFVIETSEVEGETIQRQRLDITYGGSWSTVGYIIGGSGSGGSGVIGIRTWSEDGNRYWTLDGEWLLDDNNQMVRANGIDGRDGDDSSDGYAQFLSIAFKRAATKPDAPTGGTFEQPTPISEGWSDGVPVGTSILWMTTRWFSTNPALNDSTHWSEPRQATDTAGIDIEYSNVALDGNPGNPTDNASNWYDAGTDATDPRLASANWMAIRTMSNGDWTAWAVFKIRGESGANGVSPNASFKSIIFKKSNNFRTLTIDGKTVYKLVTTEYPNNAEGSYATPTPTTGNWSDGIPATDANGNADAMIWMSTRVFSSDGEYPQQASWTEPTLVGDTADIDFEWCDAETPLYAQPTRTSPDDANPGSESDDTQANGGWYDTPSSNSDPIWMAVRHIKNGEYSGNWQVMRVKGERGTDGTSFTPKGQLFGVFSTLSAARSYYNTNKATLGTAKYAIVGAGYPQLYEFSTSNLNGTDITNTVETGDAYVNVKGGGINGLLNHVFIWDGDNFIDFGELKGDKGERGDSYYFHIKYSANADGNPMSEVPNDYIGVLFDSTPTDPVNPSAYTWMRWKGEDGFGYEYIYTLTSTNTAPNVPVEDKTTAEYQSDDHVPTGWTDDPASPSQSTPYCWVAYRRKIDGVWQDWRGQAGDYTKAALFSMWTSNGVGISGVTEKYAVGTSDENWPDISTFTTTVPAFVPSEGKIYLWNYEIISYTNNTNDSTTPAMIGVYGTGRGIESITEYYYADNSDREADLPTFGILPNTTYWKTLPSQVTTDMNNPYLWNFEVINWTDGTSTFTRPAIIGWYLFTDIEYLKNVFKKVDGDENSAQVGGVIMAVDGNQKGTAMLSGKSGEDWGESSEHGRLFIAAGMDGTTTKERINAAPFKVYEDGHVEASSANVKGYIQQYFSRLHDIATLSNGWGLNKPNNSIFVGWSGLTLTEDGSTINFGTNDRNVVQLSSLFSKIPSGRILISNQFYISKEGTVYYNKKAGPTYIRGRIVLPNGGVTSDGSSGGIVLFGGWIEVAKFSVLSSDQKSVISPISSGTSDLFIITSFGGNVGVDDLRSSWTIGNASNISGTEEDRFYQKYILANYDIQNDYGIEVYDGYQYLQLGLFNKYIEITSGNTDLPIYIALPKVRRLSIDVLPEISYYFLIEGHHRSIRFKIRPLDSPYGGSQVDLMEDLQVRYTHSNTGLVAFSAESTIPSGGNTDTTIRILKLSYIPFGTESETGCWIAEELNSVRSI